MKRVLKKSVDSSFVCLTFLRLKLKKWPLVAGALCAEALNKSPFGAAASQVKSFKVDGPVHLIICIPNVCVFFLDRAHQPLSQWERTDKHLSLIQLLRFAAL